MVNMSSFVSDYLLFLLLGMLLRIVPEKVIEEREGGHSAIGAHQKIVVFKPSVVSFIPNYLFERAYLNKEFQQAVYSACNIEHKQCFPP